MKHRLFIDYKQRGTSLTEETFASMVSAMGGRPDKARMSDEEAVELIARWREQGDTAAYQSIIRANLRLIAGIAIRVHQNVPEVPLEDFINEGVNGFAKGLSKWKPGMRPPGKPEKPASYAQVWANNYILAHAESFHPVRRSSREKDREKEKRERQGDITAYRRSVVILNNDEAERAGAITPSPERMVELREDDQAYEAQFQQVEMLLSRYSEEDRVLILSFLSVRKFNREGKLVRNDYKKRFAEHQASCEALGYTLSQGNRRARALISEMRERV